MQRVRTQIGLGDIRTDGGLGGQITVAVLDTGVAPHPDLAGKLVGFRDFIYNRRNAYDDNGHGTHVCGILCGSGKASGGKYRGIAPQAGLVVGKVLNEKGDGMAEAMMSGLEWIMENRRLYDIRILNISVGIASLQDQEKEADLRRMIGRLWSAGVVVLCAAGNKGPAPDTISSVGGCDKVITVGCHDGHFCPKKGRPCASYSGRGQLGASPRKPDLVAPGTEIWSCNSGFVIRNGIVSNGYIPKSGTSMSTPVVAGCVALLLQKEPWLTNEQVKERLKLTAVDLGAPWNLQGWGMVNAKRLLEI